MNSPHFIRNLAGQLLVLIGISATPTAIGAERRVSTTTGNVSPKSSPLVSSSLHVPHEWKSLLNPETDEFWNEGNFKPDAGFVIWARNPTIANAKLYLIRMNAKRDRLHIMQQQQEQANKELIKVGAIANDYDFLAGAFKADSKTILSSSQETQIFFLFTPTCPHCKRQGQILSGRTNVVPMQVGGSQLHHFEKLPKSVWATNEDIDRYVADKVVPVLLIYNRKTNNITSIKGVHTINEIDKISYHLTKEIPK